MSSELVPIKVCAIFIFLGGVVLVSLTGCVRYADRSETGVMYPVGPAVQTTFIIEDDYVYYPS